MEFSTLVNCRLASQVVFMYAIKKSDLAELLMLSSHSFAGRTRNWKAVSLVSRRMEGAMSLCRCGRWIKGGCHCSGDESPDDKGANV